MTDELTTSYKTVRPNAAIDLLSDKVWKIRDEEVWDKHVRPLIKHDTSILDAGCGLGRLLPRLWGAKKITMVEPDLQRFLQASVTADCMLNNNQTLLDELLSTDFHPSTSSALIEQIRETPVKHDKVVLLNTQMDDPAIAEEGPFDLIISSHVYEHITFDVIQESLAAFHHFLKPGGHLLVFLAKGPMLYHFQASEEFNHSHTFINRSKFADITRAGHDAGLGVRYLPFELFEQILAAPFAPSLQTIFAEEFLETPRRYPPPQQQLFTVTEWEAYHSQYAPNENTAGGVYIEHPMIQKRLELPVRPVQTVEEAVSLEHKVNQNEVLKQLHLIDMVVVARKV